MLVHICCAVDSHYFLQKLRNDYPNERLIGFFYDPNIHPYSEYYLRLLDVKRSCKILDIELIEGEYDTKAWLEAVKGLEKEPEKGARCAVCFDRRFEVSAQKTAEIGEEAFTSTLLTSPKKSLKQLKIAGETLAKRFGVQFLTLDYRKASGTQEQNVIAKENQLYRQDYCGCLFGLTMQREQQQKLADELFMPVSGQVQPESIEARIALYEERWQLETKKTHYQIVKQHFLNWRLKFAILRVRKEVIPAHILPYSVLKNNYTRGKIEYKMDTLHYMNRNEVKFITLESYNTLSKTHYKNVTELIFSPPSFDKEVDIRNKLKMGAYDLSTILIVDEIPNHKIELFIESEIYNDVKEVLITL
ncbi:MAG: epoxyqueuosine reductase QueH [Sulfurovum sp.]|nr:epoxyqueuosine reductase QueH [Sulfurovum sp.]MCB4745500.1 epoxyqueuosine reductase QueH [Sulfurovum sp.]MCB4745604.1 epoxyqueuosine reductase QueH [Sulfurovum sp.]MCB4748495.1 epoxyqueuosine reductase QueH [Sulfurovum sp.]MCB4750522.1 epoxyqueuosine reductase QueH [Sulfurovum sp.]